LEAIVNSVIVLLRIIHIVGGVFWVGSSILTAVFLTPAMAATGENGQKFMAHLITKSRLTASITGAAILTVLAGGVLYWIDSQGLTSRWIHSGPGLGFGLGALLALIGLVFGLIVGRNSTVLGTVASQVEGKPTAEQMARITSARQKLAYAGPISTVTLVLALLCMATARYWLI
jgi:uncharacterized membrane protein